MILRLTLAAMAFAATLATPLRAEIAIQEVTSPGGIKAWLVEDKSTPVVALSFSFSGGTATALLLPRGDQAPGRE